MGSIAICIPCRMPASTDGTKIYCIYCGFVKDTLVPPTAPVVHVDSSWKNQLQWKQVEAQGGGYNFYLDSNPVNGTIQVYRNGLLLSKNHDYYESGNSINLSACSTTGDRISIQYVKEA